MKKWRVWVEYEYWLEPECDSVHHSYAAAKKRVKELREDYPDVKSIWIEKL